MPLSVSSTGSISLQPCWRARHRAIYALSVSSTGSISLQHKSKENIMRKFTSFSILNRIDIPATVLHVQRDTTTIITFSILNRIDIPATLANASSSVAADFCFQYPQPDRYPCNARGIGSPPLDSPQLSVSSTGSISLHRPPYWIASIASAPTFSSLNPIDTPASMTMDAPASDR